MSDHSPHCDDASAPAPSECGLTECQGRPMCARGTKWAQSEAAPAAPVAKQAAPVTDEHLQAAPVTDEHLQAAPVTDEHLQALWSQVCKENPPNSGWRRLLAFARAALAAAHPQQPAKFPSCDESKLEGAHPQQPAAEPTMADVLDALQVFNTPCESEGGDPWNERDFIAVTALPSFIHNVGRAWYAGAQQPAATVRQALSDEQISKAQGECFNWLAQNTNYSGGMGGETWDQEAGRAVMQACAAAWGVTLRGIGTDAKGTK
jgi:hypothetical protein